MAELVEFCRLRDRWVRTEAGEGAVATGGSDGDLKRMAGYPSVAVMSVLGVAIGKEKKDWAKRAWCVCAITVQKVRMAKGRSNLAGDMGAVLLVCCLCLALVAQGDLNSWARYMGKLA